MRVIQIIDSLEAGGAERMAVNYANALDKTIEFSGLVATRKEGALLNQIDYKVSYLFLNKKKKIDLSAIIRLRKFVIKNKITVVHAHSTSFFLAFLLKISCPSIQLIWHDHYGDSEFLSKRPKVVLRLLIPFFSGIIVVNENLKQWSEEKLKSTNVIFLPNFTWDVKKVPAQTFLEGSAGKRILSLANLRIQKNHFLVLEVANKLKISHPQWTFHLVGKDFEDDYAQKIKDLIIAFDLEKNVFLYGSKLDIGNIIEQVTIGVLTSKSEGLPVSLLEYGLHKKPVVVTNVGQIASIVTDQKNGFLVPLIDVNLFYNRLVTLIDNEEIQNRFAENLHQKVLADFSMENTIKKYVHWIKTTICNE